MRMTTALFASVCPLLLLVACVKGNPGHAADASTDEPYVDTGGSLALPDCGYSVTSREGATPPVFGTNVFGSDPTVRLVHLGLVGDPRTSMVAQWRTADEATRASSVRFAAWSNGVAPAALTETRTGVQFVYRASGGLSYRVHQAHLCGLQPGTKYSYQVGGIDNGVEHLSAVYTFRTAPALTDPSKADVRLAFVGDSRGGYDVWQDMVDQIKSQMPDLVLFSGDAVTVGYTQVEWEDFFARAEPLFATVPLIAANGNHENNAINFYSQLALPGDQQNFGIDYGFAHITVGNDTPVDTASLTGDFRAALAADFEASKAARWKLFMHHQPMFSASTRHGPSATLQSAWLPLIDQYHLDLVLNGHDHDYEITHPLIAGASQASSTNATVFVVAGGAGADLYPKGTQSWTQYSESDYTFAMIDVSQTMLTLKPFHRDGLQLSDPLAAFSKTKN